MLIGISGLTYDKKNNKCSMSSGKSTIADILVAKHNFITLSLADPMKQVCKMLFDFSDEQLWGASAFRNAPDPRYNGLTPRMALINFGTAWGRGCWTNLWVDYSIRMTRQILSGNYFYNEKTGIDFTKKADFVISGVVIPDCRYKNEFEEIQKEGGIMIRVKRPIDDFDTFFNKPKKSIFTKTKEYISTFFANREYFKASDMKHSSEQEMAEIPDSKFDYVILNDGTVEELNLKIDKIIQSLKPQ